MRPLHTMVAVLLATLVCACGDENVMCPAFQSPAVYVEVRNAADYTPAAGHATGYLRNGTYVDSMYAGTVDGNGDTVGMSSVFAGAGTYEVVVQKSGFQTWRRTGVTVRHTRCGNESVRLVALIEPLANRISQE